MKFIQFVILKYEVGFAFAVARHSHRSQVFLCDESVAAGAETGDPNRRLACLDLLWRLWQNQLDQYSTVEITVFKFAHYEFK